MTKPRTRSKTPPAHPMPLQMPPAPPHLSAEAAVLWDGVVAYLHTNGRLEAVDGAVIEGFCMAVCRQRALQAALDKEGVVTDGKLNPILRSSESVAASVKNFAITLGLTPSARKALPAK